MPPGVLPHIPPAVVLQNPGALPPLKMQKANHTMSINWIGFEFRSYVYEGGSK